MRLQLFPVRYTLLKVFAFVFLSISMAIRLCFFIWEFTEVDKGILSLGRTFLTGFFFDLGTLSFLILPYLLYLVFFPQQWHGCIVDRVNTYGGFTISILLMYFSFLGEVSFWEEFQRRYNFIAVDYLVYTYEVVQNINESYPLPILFSALLAAVGITIFTIHKRGYFKATFRKETNFRQKMVSALPWFCSSLFFGLLVANSHADWSGNRYNNELSKAGIYSFFAAFRNNELPYPEFYQTIPEDKAFNRVRDTYSNMGDHFIAANSPKILRVVKKADSCKKALKPNVIFICIESLSARYLNSLGGENGFTPFLDSLANESILFTNLFATGTRTVRGMEAITLSIPPTPGRSIVKRKKNRDLFTIGEIFRFHGYDRNFFYGGDGYFDNMNSYFGGNGFNIIDRGRGILLDQGIDAKRTQIEDGEVSFENAWGICDEDIYNKVLKEADLAHARRRPFFDFVMTTSNHKPFTYPEDRVDIPSGSGRKGAVRYTDFAIAKFLNVARTKPWYQNTVFVVTSDHCASSAGRWELDVQNYHIPGMIFNLPDVAPVEINALCSQIDIFPTLFGLLNWDYTSNLFGCDVLKMKPEDERAFIGNYRKLGLLKEDKVVVLRDQNRANFYAWNRKDNQLVSLPMDRELLVTTISFYQVADYLYAHGGLKLKDQGPSNKLIDHKAMARNGTSN